MKYPSDSRQLVLLDLNMPVMTGFEFLEQFTQLPIEMRKNIVIVILTSSDYEEDRKRASEFHVVSGYITKPLSHEKLITIMETCFQRDTEE